MNRFIALLICLLLPISAIADPGIPAMTIETAASGAQSYTLTIQILAIMTLFTLLPGMLLTMTSFTRVIIVLAILRQALGTPQSPPNQVLLGLALFLTFFIMSPVLSTAWTDGVQPYMDGKTEAVEALQTSTGPFREFMMHQTRDSDLALFARIAGDKVFDTPDDVPLSLLVPAFVTSELKTAFQIGFLVFIPFLIIDLVVASVLMSMGMMMLSPMLISLPFKIMLFVLVDGWALLMETMAASFFI
ncbi:MAG: flagellar type III secretion system pore protein FliP [Gammaproteobacteria bacterium]|nr:flagellar type III secretion system pore protein FliP [Gammaproteobacteria bacterium]